MCILNKGSVNSIPEVKNMDKISVVVPCYNEEEALPVYYKEMCRVMDEMKDVVFELIFVDDGSSDATLGIMKDLNEKDSRCRYLSFSRNFGKEAAIYAGLKASEGDYVALMDVDLQDPPALLPEMYEILQEDGYDNVATKRATRTGEPRIRSFLSESFYKFVNAISKTEIVDGARDYRLMKRKMVQAILEMSEYNRFSKGIFGWVGFRTKWLQYDGTALTGFGSGCTVLSAFLYYDCSDHSKDAGLGRSGIRLAVTCLYYFHGQWSTASLYRNCRGVSVKDLS